MCIRYQRFLDIKTAHELEGKLQWQRENDNIRIRSEVERCTDRRLCAGTLMLNRSARVTATTLEMKRMGQFGVRALVRCSELRNGGPACVRIQSFAVEA